ncbi:MAG: TonB-dependent receptor plug domain-containing protein, partial [Bacteroidales bacterium]|nr:TonB-dependent receptor plug domain-containing protein [Bacteroidales bacterium]
MMYTATKKILSLLLLAAVTFSASAQQKLPREQILAMTTDELSELPLEDLMEAVETLGVSSVDELFALIMNKNVSSASKQEENTFTSPLSTTVITYDEMRTYGVTTIEEAFRLIPGMIVAEKTNGIYDIQMRGLANIPDNNMLLYTENANTLVLIDGRSVNNLTMGAVNFDILPIDIEDVERIEVVRGAASALYGSNAVTGVINIITKKPDSAGAIVSGNAQMGNDNTYIGNVAVRKAFNSKFAAGITLSMQQRHRST